MTTGMRSAVAGSLVGMLLCLSPAIQGQEAETGQTLRSQAVARVAAELTRQVRRTVADPIIAAEARRIVARLGDGDVEALLSGRKLKDVIDTAVRLGPPAADAKGSTPSAIGDSTSDLVFVPLAPCRIIDTRLAGGALNAGETRHFEVAGAANFSLQGGTDGGCGIPLGATEPLAAAVAVNFVAVAPLGAGNLRAWQFAQPIPGASVINYQNIGGLNLANAVIVPVAGVATLDKDLSVRADVSGAHLVADVTGYFTRFPVEELDARKLLLVSADFTTLISLSDGACAELNTCTVTAPAGTSGTVVVEAAAQFVANHASGTLDRVAIGIETASPVVCTDSATVDASDHEVPASIGSNPDVDFTISHGRTFSQPAGTTRTYRLSGRMLSGASAGDAAENSRMICTFIPD